jgi:hypothetical protein
MEMKWIRVDERLPKCSMVDNSFGVPVLVYPPYKEGGTSEMTQIFYGCRQSKEPNFYIFGRIHHGVTHWMPLPEAPTQ